MIVLKANCFPKKQAPTTNSATVKKLVTKVGGKWKIGCTATEIPATPPDKIFNGRINKDTPRAITKFPATTKARDETNSFDFDIRILHTSTKHTYRIITFQTQNEKIPYI